MPLAKKNDLGAFVGQQKIQMHRFLKHFLTCVLNSKMLCAQTSISHSNECHTLERIIGFLQNLFRGKSRLKSLNVATRTQEI